MAFVLVFRLYYCEHVFQAVSSSAATDSLSVEAGLPAKDDRQGKMAIRRMEEGARSD